MRGDQVDSQMIADWQMQVISALTYMLEVVCCSSRLAYTDTYLSTHVQKTGGNLNSFSHDITREEMFEQRQQHNTGTHNFSGPTKWITHTQGYKPQSSQRSSGCQPCPGSVSPAVCSALQSSAPSFCSSPTRRPV